MALKAIVVGQWYHQGGACGFICTQSIHLCPHHINACMYSFVAIFAYVNPLTVATRFSKILITTLPQTITRLSTWNCGISYAITAVGNVMFANCYLHALTRVVSFVYLHPGRNYKETPLLWRYTHSCPLLAIQEEKSEGVALLFLSSIS
jgi:hypothetical protein